MSTFAVTIEEVEEARAHTNSDFLDIVKMRSMAFQFIMGRDEVKPEDLIVYFPVDSLLPDNVKAILPEAISKKLSGKEKRRIKTVELRGELAQGLAWPLKTFPLDKAALPGKQLPLLIQGADLTDILGVTKYESPEAFDQHGCNRTALHPLTPRYDIEGADRYSKVAEELMSRQVGVSEKLEGTNWSAVYDHNLEKKIMVQQRSFAILPVKEDFSNTYWKTAETQGLLEAIAKIHEKFKAIVTLRGELIGPGIQENIYKLIKHEIRIFDIMLDGVYQGFNAFMDICTKYSLSTVPILGTGKLWELLDGKTIQEYSNGKSQLNQDVLREGVVITPFEEFTLEKFGRVKIKQRSPLYLSKNNL